MIFRRERSERRFTKLTYTRKSISKWTLKMDIVLRTRRKNNARLRTVRPTDRPPVRTQKKMHLKCKNLVQSRTFRVFFRKIANFKGFYEEKCFKFWSKSMSRSATCQKIIEIIAFYKEKCSKFWKYCEICDKITIFDDFYKEKCSKRWSKCRIFFFLHT